MRHSVVFSVFCLVARLLGEAPGMPRVVAYPPKVYGAEAQNWALAQDGQGVIHAGNTLGIVSFDGVRWRLLPTPGQTVVRSMATDAKGRVFVGATGELGYLEDAATGRPVFISLVDRLPAEYRRFTDVWTCHATTEGIWFQSREQLMFWNGSGFRVWKAEGGTFHGSYAAGSRVFVRQRDVGLLERVGADLVLLEGGARFAKESVWAVLHAPTGPVVVSRNLGLWRLEGRRLVPMPSPASTWLKEQAVYAGVTLRDGNLALGSLKGGVMVLSPEGQPLGVFDRSNGLPSENVKQLLVDRDGALWVALDNGLARVAWPDALTLSDERSGLRGTVWNLHRHQGRLYAAMGQGIALLDERSAAFHPRWLPVEGLAVQCLAFLSVGDRLLLGSAQGVMEIQGTRILPVRPSSSTAISLLASTRFPGRVYVGLQGGLALLRLEGNRWVDEGLVPGVKDDCYNLVEDREGDLWIATGMQGVRRITFPEGQAPVVRSYGVTEGLTVEVQPLVFRVGDRICVAHRQGFQRFDPGTGRWVVDEAFKAVLEAAGSWVKSLKAQADGRIWLHIQDRDRRRTGVAIPDAQGRYRWDGSVFPSLVDTPVECCLPEADGTVWLGGPEGVLRGSTGAQEVRPPAIPLLRHIQSGRGTVLPVPQEATQSSVLPHEDRTLRFEFSLPRYDAPEATRFQTWLEGVDPGWSPWTAEAQKEYVNLREGAYRFRVRAQDVFGPAPQERVYAFRIRPPWTRTWWAYGLYGAGGLLLMVGIVRARLRHLERRNSELTTRVAEATGQLQAQAEELSRLNEEKNHFMGMVAHDLRNPLNAIQLTAELLEDADLEEERRHWSRQVGAEAREMTHLVERFLDIAAIDSGKVVPRPEDFPLLLPLQQLMARHEGRAKQKGLILRTEFPEEGPTLESDARFVKAIVDNLLSNAVKFSPKGGEIRLQVEAESGRARIRVADQGPGLSLEDQARLFTRYTSLSARPTGGEKSTGLGLSIVKRFVEALHGTLHVESAPGRGAVFTVELPEVWPGN